MIGYWNGSRRSLGPSLHDDVAAALTNLCKAVLNQDPARLATG